MAPFNTHLKPLIDDVDMIISAPWVYGEYMVPAFQVLPLGASKGSGLAWLLDHLNIPADNVLAIGDGENDLEMLQMVGVGVAMGNAGPRVKAAADAVVGSNDDDGVAEAIQRFVLTSDRANKQIN